MFANRLTGFVSQGPGRMTAMTAVCFAQQEFSFPADPPARLEPVVASVRDLRSARVIVRHSPLAEAERVRLLPQWDQPTRQAVADRPSTGRPRNHSAAGVGTMAGSPVRRHRAPVRPATQVTLRRPVWPVRAALVGVVTLLAMVGLVVASGQDSGGAPLVTPAVSQAPVAGDGPAAVHVVQPGDTLWSIAAAVAPGSDPRPIVDELARRSGGAGLQPGQRIAIDGLVR